MKHKIVILLLSLLCVACSGPQVQPHIPPQQIPVLSTNELITSDGAHLPARSWIPAKPPKAVVISLHGMNDYSNAFTLPGEYMKAKGIAVFAYDQRGFGATKNAGIWPGEENLVSDLNDMITVVRKRYPKEPLFVLGESMGGAVVITAFARPDFPKVDGVILSAPAVWGGDAMNPFYRATLWTMAHIAPEHIMTGEGLHILASDNIPMLRELGKDPLVQKGTRVDSILGLVRLMDNGYQKLRSLQVPVLVIYGKHDEVIPPEAMYGALKDAPGQEIFAYYPEGYHMLLRDLHRMEPYDDVVSWITVKSRELPSGRQKDASEWQRKMSDFLEDEPSSGFYQRHDSIRH